MALGNPALHKCIRLLIAEHAIITIIMILILIKDEISYPLTVLFKKSLAEGVVPEDWKRANVSPIYKKGNKNIAENYRPVSLTSQCSKLMESIIRDVIVQYLEANQLLKDSQPTTI